MPLEAPQLWHYHLCLGEVCASSAIQVHSPRADGRRIPNTCGHMTLQGALNIPSLILWISVASDSCMHGRLHADLATTNDDSNNNHVWVAATS